MKNGILDADAISAYAEALAILAHGRHDLTWLHNNLVPKDRGYCILLRASQHLRRKQKGLWIISQLRGSSES